MRATFIGVDLAWQSEGNNSGLAAFRGSEREVHPVAVSGARSLDAVVDFIVRHQGDDTVVAIDAPLIIGNATGQRPCERQLSRKFAAAHAGTHTSNLGLYPAAGGVALARRLQTLGYRHCSAPPGELVRGGRWFVEVYPHPAQVVLFERSQIIKYKKGRVAARRAGLGELTHEIRTRLLAPGGAFRSSDALDVHLACELGSLRGSALKCHEDSLDAIVCSFIAWHLWRWGWERSECFGDMASGYIVVPTWPLPTPSAPDD